MKDGESEKAEEKFFTKYAVGDNHNEVPSKIYVTEEANKLIFIIRKTSPV